jgi:hypothetical protein
VKLGHILPIESFSHSITLTLQHPYLCDLIVVRVALSLVELLVDVPILKETVSGSFLAWAIRMRYHFCCDATPPLVCIRI